MAKIKIFIYLFMRDIERGRDRQREKQTPRGNPYVGLDSRIPGSCPELKADTQPLSHPGSQDANMISYKDKVSPLPYS